MNDDDRLLHALGAIARAEDERDLAVWERLAAGEGSADEAIAAGVEGLDPAEAAALADLLRPLPAGDEAALIVKAAAVLSSGTGPEGQVLEDRSTLDEADREHAAGQAPAPSAGLAPAPSAGLAPATSALRAPAPSAPVAPAPPAALLDLDHARARRRLLGAGSGVLAAAAAVLLWIRLGGPGPEADSAALPTYGMVARNQTVLDERGSDDKGIARYRRDSEIDWILSPEAPSAAATALRVLAEGTGPARLLEVAAERSDEGALRIRGRLGERLDLGPGRYTLRFLIGPASALPDGPEGVDAALRGGKVREATPAYAVEILE